MVHDNAWYRKSPFCSPRFWYPSWRLAPCQRLSLFSVTKLEVLINFTPTGEFAVENITISDYGISYISRIASHDGDVTIVQGTIPYLAPEIRLLRKTQATTESDMWSIGCIGYEMCIGLRLSAGHGEEIDRYVEGGGLDLSRIPARFGPNVRNIISTCLSRDPAKRFDARSLRDLLGGLVFMANSGQVNRQGHVHQMWPPTHCNPFPQSIG
jgi:serine/threonine protein kinase